MATERESESLPQQFGRFKVISTLGRGGMGTVYLAEDPVIGRQVAIKAIKNESGLDPDELRELQSRFEREFRSAGTLSHPNLVTLFDVGKENNTSFIAMECVVGESLADVLKSDRILSFKEIADLLRGICSGLDYAHEQGVIHRDVKPANILLNREGEPKITDFGVAKLTSTNLTRTGTVIGTPAYMSPEQITGQAVSGAADQFSVGVILYQMLTGELPFTGENPTTILYKIVHDEPERPHTRRSSLPPKIDEVVMRALEKDADKRFKNCAELARAAESALGLNQQRLDLTFEHTEPGLRTAVLPRGVKRDKKDKKEKTAAAPSRSRTSVGPVVAIIALVIALGAAAYTFRDAIPGLGGGGTAEARPFSEQLVVSSTDPGASIWINGADTGLETPASVPIEGNVGDALSLELRRGEHRVAGRDLVLGAGLPKEWMADEASLPSQTYELTSSPAGARVTINGEPLEGVTPLPVELVEGSRYEILVELDEYQPATHSFVYPDELRESSIKEQTLSFPLRPKVPPSTIRVSAAYPVTLKVGGRSYGPSKSLEVRQKPGEARLDISSDEVFLRKTQSVTLQPNETVSLELPKATPLRVLAQPSNCRVSINGRFVDETPFSLSLVPGTYEFQYEWPALGKTKTQQETITEQQRQIFGTPD